MCRALLLSRWVVTDPAGICLDERPSNLRRKIINKTGSEPVAHTAQRRERGQRLLQRQRQARRHHPDLQKPTSISSKRQTQNISTSAKKVSCRSPIWHDDATLVSQMRVFRGARNGRGNS